MVNCMVFFSMLINYFFIENHLCRQIPKSFFNKSDLFFLCMMRPLSFHIQKQDLEIEAAQVIIKNISKELKKILCFTFIGIE